MPQWFAWQPDLNAKPDRSHTLGGPPVGKFTTQNTEPSALRVVEAIVLSPTSSSLE